MFHSLRYSALVLALFGGMTVSQAQQNVSQPANTYSLEDCIRIALETNPQVKQSEITVQTNGNTYEQSKWQRWPSISFSASQGFRSGRNIDPFTNVVRVTMMTLRKKLGDPPIIETVPGAGYRL